MTEREWLRTATTEREWVLWDRLSEIKELDYCMGRCGILFAAVCCRRIWHLLPDEPSRAAILAAEKYANGLADRSAVEAAEQKAYAAAEATREELPDLLWKATPIFYAMWAASCLTGAMSSRRPISGAAYYTQQAFAWHLFPAPQSRKERETTQQEEAQRQVGWLRDIFGNPFRPISIQPDWLTWNGGTAVKLARMIYDECRFGDIPILADALEEAGCTDAAILDHCRQPGEHVRGCWVVDLLLGKS
jgi:hypothetical protein